MADNRSKTTNRVKRIEAVMGRLNHRITARLVGGGKYPDALFRAVWKLAAVRADALGKPEQAVWIRGIQGERK